MSSGTRILDGKYELVAPAGVGGMATVWRGKLHGQEGFSRTVAIKRLHSWVAEQPRGVEMFLEEARIISELFHPNIVQVFDFQQDPKDGRYLIVLEWVEGLDLGRYLKTALDQGTPAPWPLMVGVLIEVLRALSAAHAGGTADEEGVPIFHRDVSPSNVLVSVSGISKLADFGMARAMDRVTVTQPGVLKGKLAYMAPEYIAKGRASASTDLYAAGVILWEGLAGRRLRSTTDPVKLFAAASEDVPALDAIRSDLPPALVSIVRKAVAKNPDARFESAGEMGLALRDLARESGADTDPTFIGRCIQEIRPYVRSDAQERVEESGEYPPPGAPLNP